MNVCGELLRMLFERVADIAGAWYDLARGALFAPPATIPERPRPPVCMCAGCTCVGTCGGLEGLGPRWRCALDQAHVCRGWRS